MAPMLIGTKLGMTRVFDADGASVPVTVIEIGACVVTQVRDADKDGYAAVQIASGEMKPRNSTIPMIGHDAKADTDPKRFHREFRCTPEEAAGFEVGQELSVSALEGERYVDVIGTSKGKGFAGGMKRYGFKGQLATHGVERKHRSPGSIGGHALNAGKSGRLKKGKRMAGHMGSVRVTTRSLDVIRIDAERGLLLVKGPVPGHNKAMVQIRPAVRLNRSKARQLASQE